eukprot:6228371-Ditylum_brightwellii.AAC.1
MSTLTQNLLLPPFLHLSATLTTDYASIVITSWILTTSFPPSYKGKKDPESCAEEWHWRRIVLVLASTVLY